MQAVSRSRRSFLAQFILGILPPEIETVRYTPVYDKHPRDYVRHAIWDIVKRKFVLFCPLYSNIRQMLLNPILIDNPNFSNLSNLELTMS